VSTVWSRLEKERPETAGYLRLYRKLDLRDAPRDTVVFDISGHAE
jgi:hypothetical protein